MNTRKKALIRMTNIFHCATCALICDPCLEFKQKKTNILILQYHLTGQRLYAVKYERGFNRFFFFFWRI